MAVTASGKPFNLSYMDTGPCPCFLQYAHMQLRMRQPELAAAATTS